MKFRRIAIIGISAVGKSTLARQLSLKFDLPFLHMDQLWWKPYWEETKEAAVAEKLSAELKKESWIIEGYIEPHSAERLRRADIVLYLDYSGWLAVIGGIKRIVCSKKREEMPEGCEDNLDWNYLKTMLYRKERPEIEEAIKPFASKIIRLKSRRSTNKFITKLCNER